MNKYKNLNILKKFKSICIIGHTSPDIDDVNSMLSLKYFLMQKFNFSKIDLFLDYNKLTPALQDSIGDSDINPKIKKYDCAIRIDCTTVERLGKFKQVYLGAPFKINIDHHSTNDLIADINIVEKISSACELVYNIMKSFHVTPNNKTLCLIYGGILTDTNGFSVGDISENTFNIAAECAKKINIYEIYRKTLTDKSLLDMQMLAEAINNIEEFSNGKIIFTYLTQKALDKYKASQDDVYTIPNTLNSIKTAKIICFVSPNANILNVSLRSKEGYNIGHIAQKYGGGGHPCSAGLITSDDYETIKTKLLEEFKKIVKK